MSKDLQNEIIKLMNKTMKKVIKKGGIKSYKKYLKEKNKKNDKGDNHDTN